MTLIGRIKIWRRERRWFKYGRKDMFTWVHRYLRLHSELLEDTVYQEMFEYYRNTLIAYLKKEAKDKNKGDTQYGEVIDVLADIYNKSSAERVNKCKPMVDELYKLWKENLNSKKEIRI